MAWPAAAVGGARPLKRAIQSMLENPLSRSIIAGEFGHGDSVLVDLDAQGHLDFRKS